MDAPDSIPILADLWLCLAFCCYLLGVLCIGGLWRVCRKSSVRV